MAFMVDEKLLQKELSDLVVVVTGGESGIGKCVATQLFKQGATVIIGSLKMKDGEKVRKELKDNHNASEEALEARFHVVQFDLSDFASIRAFATYVCVHFPKLNCLVNNAGTSCFTSYSLTKQGHEMIIGVNYIGPFLLTQLLTKVLALNGSAERPSRIINTASCTAVYDPFNARFTPMPDLGDWSCENKKHVGFLAYGQSKLASVLHAMELDRRFKREGKPIQAVSVYPGYVLTNLFRFGFLSYMPQFVVRFFYKMLLDGCPISVWEGSQTTLHCVLCDDLHGGLFYSSHNNSAIEYPKDIFPIIGWPCKRYPSPEMTDENAQKLWAASEKCILEN